MKRLVLVQLTIFAVIAAMVIPFGIRYVAGPAGLGEPMRVTTTMTDAFGLTAGTSVTVRGVQVGTVDSVALDTSGAARVTLALDPHSQIPRDSVLTVGMGTAAGIQSVDIMPNTDAGPYLNSGDTIAAPADRQPVQMDAIMTDAARLVKGIDPQAVSAVGTELSAAFDGLGPPLATMIDHTGDISARVRRQLPALRELLAGTTELVTTMAAQNDSFVAGMGAGSRLTGQLDGSGPVFLYLTEHSPAVLNSVRKVLDTYRGTFGAVLANLATVAPIVANRSDALATGLESIPKGLRDLTSIVKGDRADFSLIATQGPVCSYDVNRRTIGDVSPIEPNLVMYCPPAPDMQMRGAVNAPRPDDLGIANQQIPGTPIGPPVVDDPIKIPTLAQIVYKWRNILKGNDDVDGH